MRPLLVAIVLLSACAPPPSGSSTDDIHKKQRSKRKSYTESTTIKACSESGCHPLTANINHISKDDGTELKKVNQIDFPNGGYLRFTNAYIGGSAVDTRGRTWTFS